MVKIIPAPNPILNQPTKPVKQIDKRIKKIIKEMIKTLEEQKDPPGVGLAANQIGYSLSIFIIKPEKKSPIKVFINPTIIKQTGDKGSDRAQDKKKEKNQPALEGCLSIKKIWANIKRSQKVYIKYQDENGDEHKQWFQGFEATIIQHEIDHLKGILFTQRALEQKQTLYKEENNQLSPLL